jgi:predicted nucleic acid-binding protein
MIGLDCNILVQLAFAEHPANAGTVAAVQSEIGRGVRLAFPPLIITESPGHMAAPEPQGFKER